MNIDIEQFEIIEAYLNVELSPADKVDFENQINADVNLSKAVDEHRNIKIGLRAIKLEDELKSIANNYRKPSIVPLWQKLWAKAASVLLFIGIGIWGGISYNSYKQSEKLFSDNYSFDENDFVKKDLSTSSEVFNSEEFEEAIKSIKNNEFDNAIKTLDKIPVGSSSIYYKKYYLGISYLAKNNTKLAIESLKTASNTKEKPFLYKAKWYLALSYLKNRDNEKTIEVLNDLINIDNPYQQKARKLYSRLVKQSD